MAKSKPTFKGELMFPSQYLAGEDLKGKDVTVTIANIGRHTLRSTKGEEEECWLVAFKGATKKMILKKCHAEVLSHLYGQHAEKWIGKSVTLTTERVRAFGQMWNALRVKDTAAAAEPLDSADEAVVAGMEAEA